jgi:hypothetical protein
MSKEYFYETDTGLGYISWIRQIIFLDATVYSQNKFWYSLHAIICENRHVEQHQILM